MHKIPYTLEQVKDFLVMQEIIQDIVWYYLLLEFSDDVVGNEGEMLVWNNWRDKVKFKKS